MFIAVVFPGLHNRNICYSTGMSAGFNVYAKAVDPRSIHSCSGDMQCADMFYAVKIACVR
jgi:hypothetical protein